MAKNVAKGTLLQVGDGAGPPENFTTIPHVGDIDGPGGDSAEIDVTDHGSPGSSDEFLPGTTDPGDLTATVHFDPQDALHQQLAADQQSQTTRTYQLVYPDAANTIARFPAYVRTFRPAAPVKGALTFQLALRVSGAVDWDAV